MNSILKADEGFAVRGENDEENAERASLSYGGRFGSVILAGIFLKSSSLEEKSF